MKQDSTWIYNFSCKARFNFKKFGLCYIFCPLLLPCLYLLDVFHQD